MIGDLDFWRKGLSEAGIDIRDRGEAELVVAPAASAATALEQRPVMVVVHGDAARPLEAAGYVCRTYLPIPSPETPRAWLPLDAPLVSSYALERWIVPTTGLKSARNKLLRELIKRRRAPARSTWLTIGAQSDPVPSFVRTAATRVDTPGPAWFLSVGAGDSLDYRGVFHLFPRDAPEPRWIVKFARRPGLTDPFDRDRIGLGIAAEAGSLVASHAPELVATFEHEGVPASIETAAVGAALSSVLRSNAARRVKEGIVESVADWVVEMGAATATPNVLEKERLRIAQDVLPEWAAFGAPVDLLDAIGDVSGVVQHDDLWSENVIVDRGSFQVVDWEDARRHGLPLWDLVYFLGDALALLDGAYDERARRAHFVSLFKGQSPSSPTLFRWVRSAITACSVPAEAVGPIVTACWLSNVLKHVTRGEDAARFAIHGLSELPAGEQWATLWLSDPELGPRWSAWRA